MFGWSHEEMVQRVDFICYFVADHCDVPAGAGSREAPSSRTKSMVSCFSLLLSKIIVATLLLFRRTSMTVSCALLQEQCFYLTAHDCL